jgi:hypothetical protein
VGPVLFLEKARWNTLRELLFLDLVESTGHVGHSSATMAQNIVALFFMLRWARYSIQKKHAGIHYVELVFLRPVVFAGLAVHSGASGARNVDTLFLCSGVPSAVSINSIPGHDTPNMCFSIR